MIGNLVSISYSNANGSAVTNTYDKLNRLQTVVGPGGTTTYGYDPAGNLGGYAYPNGVTTSYNYDGANRLTSMQADWGTTTVASYAYTLGRAGNRTSVAELSGRTVAYGYDDLYRLTSETISNDPGAQNGAIGYIYDKVGNRREMSSTVPAIPPGMFNYDANDRLQPDDYDANGNITNSAGIQNQYDFENRLIRHGYMTMVYDGDGNRVAEAAGGVTTNYLVDTQNPTGYAQVVEELQGGAVVRSYTWGHWLLAQTQLLNDAWTTSFYGYDGHGSVRYLTDASGTVTDTYDYDAFGNLLSSTGTTPNNYLFAGEQYDPALGLYYNRARWLDVRVGRFWGMDTYEGNGDDPATLHKYVYANDNAVNNIDPGGNDSIAEMNATFSIASVVAATSMLQTQNFVGGNILEPDVEIRKNIADVAKNYVGSHNWLESPGANKCNIFVFDVLTKAGHAPPKLGGTIGYYFGYKLGISALLRYAPLAGQWADTTVYIPSWDLLSGGPSDAEPGDIIAEQINYSDATGHVGIVVGPRQTASADSTAKPPGTITITDFGFRPDNDKRPRGHAIHSIVRRFNSKQSRH